MKKIKRPDSTTIVVETFYHYIKNTDEVRNIFSIPYKQIILLNRFIDFDTFQPLVGFLVLRDKSSDDGIKLTGHIYTLPEYYMGSIEQLVDSDCDGAKELLKINEKLNQETNGTKD